MCKHEFIGHEDGVTCNKCGLNLSIAEYRDFLAGKLVEEAPKQAETVEAEKPKRRTTIKKGA